jgi:hypothetical protein
LVIGDLAAGAAARRIRIMHTESPALRGRVRDRLYDKLPEILIEACSVALAVVLALWANDWSGDRQLDREASVLQSAVVAELRSNLVDLDDGRPSLQRGLDDARRFVGPDGDQMHALDFTVDLSLLSAAAWQTTQSSQASQRMGTDWRVETAKVYELQALYQRQQEATLAALNTFAVLGNDERPRPADVRALEAQMRTMMTLNQQLSQRYRSLLHDASR